MCNANETTIHKFEEAGCGIAPFRIIGVEIRTGPIKQVDENGNFTGVEIGAPGQPMGCCEYCGQGIAECWIIEDANGHRFMVGSTCVDKTGDAGLKKQKNPHKRKLKHDRDDARIGAAVALLSRDDVREAMSKLPHTNEHWAAKGETFFNEVEWFFKNAGRSGKVKAARKVEKFVKELDA